MSWKSPRGIHEKPKAMKPQKLPAMKRGVGLRVGRVVADARGSTSWDNQSSSPFVQEEERRVQEELMEILTVKLANKEKEIEMLRCKQNVVDKELCGHDQRLQQQQEEHTRVISEMTSTNHELQRQVQLLQLQCEQLRVDSGAQRTAALEQRRLREKDQAHARFESKNHQRTIDDLRRERQQNLNERYVLETKLQQVLQNQGDQSTLVCLAFVGENWNADFFLLMEIMDVQVDQLQARCLELEDEIKTSHQSCQQLQEALETEEQKRRHAEQVSKKLEAEKQALEEKQRALMKALKGTSSRAAGVEKKRSELSRVEDQLTEQLTALKKENQELKARRGQMSSQTKHLQARVAALENVNAAQDRKLEDAVIELESARKYYRDCQFRAQQLQEEIVFLKNRKVPASPQAVDNIPTPAPDVLVPESASETAGGMPCWMKG